jgi:homogentisate 1,2-dioxygenase
MFYVSKGNIPHKRHTQFRKEDGSLYYEQLFGQEGFSGRSSLMYHAHRPTQIQSIDPQPTNVAPTKADDFNITPRKLFGWRVPGDTNIYSERNILMFNQDVQLGMLIGHHVPERIFLKNSDADELWFVHEGKGTLLTMFGNIDVVYGDYVYIPKGCIYQWRWSGPYKLLYIEASAGIDFPKRYKNTYGQFLEHAPFCERDIRLPELSDLPAQQKGDFQHLIKKGGFLHKLSYAAHPFDVIGWDGCVYPFALSIHDFEPITGRVHQPPPVHQTFAAGGFVVCSFVPRLYDYHPDSIPAPYHHSNIDSDELLYYVAGDFMSRTGVEPGQMTLHPAGIPHGPHPGTIEKSIGEKATEELAVMVDTFAPLFLTPLAYEVEDPKYPYSWLSSNH